MARASSLSLVDLKKEYMQHVMIDMETLGTEADAVILSIGAVKFDLDSDRIDDAALYASLSIESNLEAKRHLSEQTLLWHLKQPLEVQAVFHEPKQTLRSALEDLSAWWSGSQHSKFVWSNGADFDIAILAHAYRQQRMETPWEFYDSRCVRTYKNIPGMKGIRIDNALKHNALADAVSQAKLVQAIQRKLSMLPHPMVKAVA